MCNKLVNIGLYELLKEVDTGFYYDTKQVLIPYVHLPFSDLETFTRIVGPNYFEDGGVTDVKLTDSTVVVDLDYLITEYFGQKVSSYKSCFDEYVWDQYSKEIYKQEEK